jgi:hypothetical protein
MLAVFVGVDHELAQYAVRLAAAARAAIEHLEHRAGDEGRLRACLRAPDDAWSSGRQALPLPSD